MRFLPLFSQSRPAARRMPPPHPSSKRFLSALVSVIAAVSIFTLSPSAQSDRPALIPGGMTFGVKFSIDGALVVGVCEISVSAENTLPSPAYEAGIRAGDIITAVSASDIAPQPITSAGDLTALCESCAGSPLTLTVTRSGGELSFDVAPKADREGRYRLGLWIRDTSAGIGTVTYIDPETLSFGGLGHGIYDPDTGVLLPMTEGECYPVKISGIRRGSGGSPGQLSGHFSGSTDGIITSNTDTGVYGCYAALPPAAISAAAVPIAHRDEVTEGAVEILSALDGGEVTAFSAEITLNGRSDLPVKNFVVEVTDTRLLERTGGIVQGMSGSPIIQDGKLIGAVTHVFVSDPTRGYGIFIENMLAEAEKIK